MKDSPLVEVLSAKLHGVYMKEARRQDDVRHVDAYEDLKESTKEYDRVLARFILKHVSSQIFVANQIIADMCNDPLE